jgi:MFS family permease
MTKGEEPPGGAGTLLREPDFLRLWFAGTVANAMRWLEMLAIGVYTYDLTGSAFLVALMSVSRGMPLFLLGAFAGAIADSVSRKALLLGGLVAMALVSGTLGLLSWSGRLELWQIGVGSVISGFYWAVEMATRRTMIGEVAGVSRMAEAIALDSTTNHMTRMAGPLAGGFIYQTAGLTGAFAIAAVLHAVSAIPVVALRYSQAVRPLAIARIPGEIVEGMRIARQRPIILGVLAITVAMNFFGFSYTAMMPAVGRDQFEVSATLIGLLVASEAAGGMVGALIITWARPALSFIRLFVAGSILLLAGVALAALAPWYLLALLLLFVGGLGVAGFGSMQSTLVLTEAPIEMRSRLMGLLTVCIGTGPLGVLHVGFVSRFVEPSTAVLMIAIAGLAAVGLVLLKWPQMRK